MPGNMLMIGAAIFGASVLLVLVLLVANGGASKSRQFEVLGNVLAGRNGAASRILLILALGGVVVGAITAFSGVGRMDATQRQQCQDSCVKRGFKQGAIGLSANKDAYGKSYKACLCSGGAEKDLELDLNTLGE